MSRTLRSTSPAWPARSESSFRVASVAGSAAGIETASAPSSSSSCRTGTATSASIAGRSSPDAASTPPAVGSVPGQLADGCSAPSSFSQTSAAFAPVPSATTRAISSSTTSFSRPGHPGGERREHLIRRRAVAVDDAVGEAPRAREHRLEQHRDEGGGDERQHRAAGALDERADAADDERVDQDEEHGDRADDHGLADHDLDVVEAVTQDRRADRRGDAQHDRREEDGEHRVAARDLAADGRADDLPDEEEQEPGDRDVREPFDPLPVVARSTAEADDDATRCTADPQRSPSPRTIASRTEITSPNASMPAGFWYLTNVDSENWNCTGFTDAAIAVPTKPTMPAHRTGRHRREGRVPVGNRSRSRASEPAASTSDQRAGPRHPLPRGEHLVVRSPRRWRTPASPSRTRPRPRCPGASSPRRSPGAGRSARRSGRTRRPPRCTRGSSTGARPDRSRTTRARSRRPPGRRSRRSAEREPAAPMPRSRAALSPVRTGQREGGSTMVGFVIPHRASVAVRRHLGQG